MKKIAVMIFLIVLLLSAGSCVVLTPHDNGRHNGWFRNTRNHGKSNVKSSPVIIVTEKK